MFDIATESELFCCNERALQRSLRAERWARAVEPRWATGRHGRGEEASGSRCYGWVRNREGEVGVDLRLIISNIEYSIISWVAVGGDIYLLSS